MQRQFFEIKAFDEKTGEFEGIASVYNVTDLYGDSVQPGAFSRTLDHSKGKYPLLWQHRPDEPIGECMAMDSETGLMVKGKLNLDVQKGREAYALLKQGVVKGLSIGYNVVKEAVEGAVRLLKEIALWEVSLVTFPACPPAQVTAIKAVVPFQDLPLADETRPWDSARAIARVRAWAGAGEGISDSGTQEKYQQAFLWYDSEAPEDFGSYKLPIADVIDGRLTAIPRGIFSAAGVLMGAMGGVDIPESDQNRIKRNLSRYYSKLDRTPPWEDKDSFDGVLANVIGHAEMVKVKKSKIDKRLLDVAIKTLEALAEADHDGTDSGSAHSDPSGDARQPADEEEIKALTELVYKMANNP